MLSYFNTNLVIRCTINVTTVVSKPQTIVSVIGVMNIVFDQFYLYEIGLKCGLIK